jgi:hypothetical protein
MGVELGASAFLAYDKRSESILMRTLTPFREGTTPIAVAKLRFLWIALAVFVGTLLVTQSASAACNSMPGSGTNSSTRGCCKASKPVMPVRASAEPSTFEQRLPLPNENTCPNKPGCVCCPQFPAAPEPKGQRPGENRPEPDRNVAAIGGHDTGSIARPATGPVPPLLSPPQKSPLYLRNSRLLI